jgi:glutathione S-transferase
MIELYHDNLSVCAQKVRIVLAEKNLPWTNRHVNLAAAEHLTPEFKKMNPRGVVPVLVHDGNVIVESSVICSYLDEAFPNPALMPKNPVERAAMRLWCKLPDDILHMACATVSFAISFGQQLKKRAGAGLEERLMKMPDPARRERQRALIEKGIETPFFRDHIKAVRKDIRRDGGAARQDEVACVRRLHLGGYRDHALRRTHRSARPRGNVGEPAASRRLVFSHQGAAELQGDRRLSADDRLRRHRPRRPEKLAADQGADRGVT